MESGNKKQALLIIGLGVAITCIALVVLPLTAQWQSFAYTENSAYVGSTFGGIAGPFLSFTALSVLFFSLREQARTNDMQAKQLHLQQGQLTQQQEQFRTIVARQNNENFFELTYKIVERFNEAVERQKRLFLEVPKVSLDRKNNWETSDIEGERRPARQGEFLIYQQQFFVLTEFFNIISRRIDDDELRGLQKLLLLDLIEMGYGARLRTAIVEYQQLFVTQELNEQPEEMYRDMTEQNILIFQLRERADAQASTERIPFGDDEPSQTTITAQTTFGRP